MKVLMLNPPGPYCRAGSRWPHRRPIQSVGIDYHPFPFGLAYAASRARADGHAVRVLDCIALGMSADALIAQVREFDPDVVFMETSAPSFRGDVEIMRAIGRPCVAGGAHATATTREHIQAGFAGVIRGEYDQVITDALRLLPRPWLATKTAPATEHAPLVVRLDDIPWPAWDLLPMEKYNDPICRGRSVTVLSSRGCPHRCSFCTLAPYHGGHDYRLRDPKAVCDEIAELIRRYHPDEIYFDDDSISLNRKHVLALCEELRRRRFGVPFSCMGHAAVAHDVLEAMAAAGCRAYKFGVESADPDVLRQIPKALELDDVVRTVHDCRRLGIRTHATFVFGLPGETRESAMKTIEFALRLRTHTLQFAIATPYPGTALYEHARGKGWLIKEDWNDFDPAAESVLSYPDYSAADIAEMHALAWRRWQWHILTRQPGTLFHHFHNAYERGGVAGLGRLGWYGAGRLVSFLKARR